MPTKGLDALSREMEELGRAMKALDGEITTVGFDPNDPQSIEHAIGEMESAIDERVSSYSNNKIVKGIVVDLKEKYRQSILNRAEQGRLEEQNQDDD